MATLGYVGNFVWNNIIARVKDTIDNLLQNIDQTKHLCIKNLYNHFKLKKVNLFIKINNKVERKVTKSYLFISINTKFYNNTP